MRLSQVGNLSGHYSLPNIWPNLFSGFRRFCSSLCPFAIASTLLIPTFYISTHSPTFPLRSLFIYCMNIFILSTFRCFLHLSLIPSYLLCSTCSFPSVSFNFKFKLSPLFSGLLTLFSSSLFSSLPSNSHSKCSSLAKTNVDKNAVSRDGVTAV